METVVKYQGKLYVWRKGYNIRVGHVYEGSKVVGARIELEWGDEHCKRRAVFFSPDPHDAYLGDYNYYEPTELLEGQLIEGDTVIGDYYGSSSSSSRAGRRNARTERLL